MEPWSWPDQKSKPVAQIVRIWKRGKCSFGMRLRIELGVEVPARPIISKFSTSASWFTPDPVIRTESLRVIALKFSVMALPSGPLFQLSY